MSGIKGEIGPIIFLLFFLMSALLNHFRIPFQFEIGRPIVFSAPVVTHSSSFGRGGIIYMNVFHRVAVEEGENGELVVTLFFLKRQGKTRSDTKVHSFTENRFVV